jgi:hypothetical protein
MAKTRIDPAEKRIRATLASEKHLVHERLPSEAFALRHAKGGPRVAAAFFVADEGAAAWRSALSELQVADLLEETRERVQELGEQGHLPVLGWFGPLRLYGLKEVLAEHEKRAAAAPLFDFEEKKPRKRAQAEDGRREPAVLAVFQGFQSASSSSSTASNGGARTRSASAKEVTSCQC